MDSFFFFFSGGVAFNGDAAARYWGRGAAA